MCVQKSYTWGTNAQRNVSRCPLFPPSPSRLARKDTVPIKLIGTTCLQSESSLRSLRSDKPDSLTDASSPGARRRRRPAAITFADLRSRTHPCVRKKIGEIGAAKTEELLETRSAVSRTRSVEMRIRAERIRRIPIPATTCSPFYFYQRIRECFSLSLFFLSRQHFVAAATRRIRHTRTTWRLGCTWYKCFCFLKPG